ncbi:pyridoxamine 5'-phosphate oxidase family protein [Paraconexibacter algicola]|uniref:Pyridoxamine 5'-phosphate oxidase n=1 Tax=Paraconexibacter algicola TaxID=2133960 RepID=A0A2T4UI69_9ACTN|nr:pyridoxamine 5'-phosphate oxidase family protein [Paraconexibacter algicola]PTL58930.1 pyridoxamine 5'-phosphate oxidase [Paraconexibacter algicola]
MPSWSTFADAAPALAQRARARLDAHVHKTLATVRADGSPRISGIETRWLEGDLFVGSMPGARKALDLRRDPRFALHSGSEDPPAWPGDAKLAGVAHEVTDDEAVRLAILAGTPDADAHVFRLDLREVSTVHVEDDVLVVEVWTPERGLRRIERT